MMTLTRSALLILIAAVTSGCGDDQVSGPDRGEAGLTLARATAPPGAVVGMSGLPSSVAPETHWVEVGGERSPLILEGGVASFVVPTFLDEAAMWPAPPTGAQDVEVHSAAGVAARAPVALTVQPLQPADGATEAIASALAKIGPLLSLAAIKLPPGTGETRRFLLAIGGALDSLPDSPDVAMHDAVSELKASPQQLHLLDALLVANGTAQRVERFTTTLLSVVNGLPGAEPQSMLWARDAAGATGSSVAAGTAVDALSDEMLSQLMQLAVYMKQNTDFQSELGSDLSALLSLASVLGINADKDAPIGKVLKAVAVASSLQALVVNTYVVSALPSRLDSLTVQLASDTIAPDAVTNATVRVFASNEPDPVSLGDYLSVFRKVASLFAQGDYFEKTANYLIGKSGDLLAWIADNDKAVEYDTDIVNLWSMPDVAFEAIIEKRELVVLKTADAKVVAPEETDVNWVATAADSGKTTVTVEPSIGPANIPILMEWFADYISENSGSASNLVLGSFGEDIVASAPKDVWVLPRGMGPCPAVPAGEESYIGNASRVNPAGNDEIKLIRFDYDGIIVEAQTQAPEGLNWSSDVLLHFAARELVALIPVDGWPDDGVLYLNVRRIGRTHALIATGTSLSRVDSDDARVRVSIAPVAIVPPNDYATTLEVQADGGQAPGQPAVSEAVEEVKLAFDRDGFQWKSLTSVIEGRLRTRGYSRSATVRAEFSIEMLGVTDSGGRPVDAQICTASGTAY